MVLNPRGVREYVRTDTFFRAIPGVLSHRPDVVFVAPGMRGNTVAERWVKILGVHDAVRLLPTVSRPDMADLFRMASVTVSPSEHDGTPNTLLEAMACASFPVVGDIESVREWIVDGVNGLLFEPGDPDALAAAIVRALADEGLRCAAATRSRRLIEENANYARVMESAEAYYRHISEIGTSA